MLRRAVLAGGLGRHLRPQGGDGRVGTSQLGRLLGRLTGLQAAGWEPRLIVLHPSDWFSIASVRDTSGGYVLGSPRDPAPAALWGVPVVLSASMPSGKALVLDTEQVAVLDRESVEVEASRHHNGNFTRNLVTLLAELRAGLAVFAPSAVRVLDLQPTP